MADLVIGTAKLVVDATLTKALAAIEEETKLRQSVQRNLVFIVSECQMMQSFLKLADGERLKNIVVMTLVRQIRDLAYDVEDCIEFVVHLDKRNRWWLRMLQEPGRWIMPCLPSIPLDAAADELERLKVRVENVSASYARYNLINDSGSKPAAPPEHRPASLVSVGSTAFDSFVSAAGTNKGNLTHLLLSNKGSGSGDLQEMAVWGWSGADHGMTSVVWNTYIHEETSKSFPCRAWIKLRRPFIPDEFARSLVAQFISNTWKEQEGGIIALDVLEMMKEKHGELHAELAQFLNKESFLVVLEDLSSMQDWLAITKFFPKNGKKGSCIIVSTLNFEVASLSVGDPYHALLLLNEVSAQHSVYAFYRTEIQRDGYKRPCPQWLQYKGDGSPKVDGAQSPYWTRVRNQRPRSTCN